MKAFQSGMRKKRARGLLAALTVVAVGASLITASASAKPRANRAPVNVLVLAAESGALAAPGASTLHGAVAAARILNASGGLLGHKVTLKILDTASNPVTAVTVLNQALGSGTKYSMVLADFGVISAAVSPIVASHPDILYTALSATPTQTPDNCPNCYFSGPSNDTQAEQGAYYAHKLGYKSMALLTTDNATGHGYGASYSKWAASFGMKYSEGFAPVGTLDATPQLQQVLANKPDVLVMAASGSAAAWIPARAKLGNRLPVICDQGCAGSASWANFNADQIAGVKALTTPFLIAGLPATKTFAFHQYLRYLGKVEPTHPLGVYSGIVQYENMLLMRAAARRCKCLDARKWATELEKVTTSKDVPGWIGPPTLFSPKVHSLVQAPSYAILITPHLYNSDGLWPGK
jgi:ABC-type branched-subunit amino acid transport system substrate-binding protein